MYQITAACKIIRKGLFKLPIINKQPDQIHIFMKSKIIPFAALLLLAVTQAPGTKAQNRPSNTPTATTPPAVVPAAPKTSSPKPYAEVITEKARTSKGLFKIHKLDDKWYFEIPDSLFNRDILVVNRLSKAATGMSNGFTGYAGDIINNNVIRFEKGPNNRVFLRRVSFDERATDTAGMYKAVMNSNMQPIMQSFEIKAIGSDSISKSTSAVIDMTDYISGDNDVLFFNPFFKASFQLGAYQSDRSYIQSIRTYPINVEIKTVKTYLRGSVPGLSNALLSGAYTVELNCSMVLLPAKPTKPRYFDPRVGYFTRSYTDFDANPQGVKDVNMVVRWKLEPKDEDIEKYKRGELVEPKKPIIYYIDPATPKKWVPYLIQGVNDWQVAFEKAGFKNAIMAKLAPTPQEDSTWSLEDARFSAIVYKPSETQNASGPNVHDPRSGEIMESHINWYHNVMQLLRNWYFIQTSPLDTAARKMTFDDELMGRLIRFVSSHEVGHTLGLRHNFGSSSTVPVDSLRNKKWVEKNGHTPSIMDYARFNYVAQPEDNIGRDVLVPYVGDYDKWAIEWGYRWLPQFPTAEEEVPYLSKLTSEKLKNNRLWFGTETNPDDPRLQNEDLGNDAMKASAYGIKNLQRIVPNLINWTRQPNEGWEALDEMYSQVVTQYGRYMGHVTKNIGGIYETPKPNDQPGVIYEYTPKSIQKEAMSFLNKQLFSTPTWLINKDIFSRTGANPLQIIGIRQDRIINTLLSTNTLSKLIAMEASMGNNAYKANEMVDDLRKNIFAELYARQAADVFRRNLQKMFVERIISLLPGGTPSTGTGGIVITFQITPSLSIASTDVYSILRGTLRTLRTDIRAALPAITDGMTKMHLLDLEQRITKVLDPK